MFGRKGQGAMEYLMTYGWAILVVMVVGIVMWQLGIFNMGGATLTATGFAKIKPQLAGSGISRTGNPKLIFTNGVGTQITIVSARIIDMNVKTRSCPLTSAMFVSKNVAAGENTKLSTALTSCMTPGTPGGVYQASISLNYLVTVGGVTTSHTESGSLRGPLE
jgi:hypothetical protein